ncbi:MAG: trigger factor [Acidimicrobiia bacterium]
MAEITRNVEPADDNKVRLHVTVPADEFETAIDAAFRKLAREVKIPGFRPGKAPRRLLEARFGPEVAREQALKDSVPDYYMNAVLAEGLDTIAAPELKITAGEDGGDVEFDAVVEVRPVVTLTGYDALQVRLDVPPVGDEQIDAQVANLRERFADLAESDTPLIDGDYATIDLSGSVNGEGVPELSATDFLYEVGAEMIVPALDVALRGKKPGDILEFTDVLPERFGDAAGQEVSFRVLVKETKRKVLPEVTDDWVSEVSEFDTVDALRADVRARMELVGKVQAQMALRDRVLEELAAMVDVDAPETLVVEEMQQRLHDFAHRLEQQGATIAQYLAATGQEQDAFIGELRAGATQGVKADLGLRAVVAQEALVATDDELDAEVERLAERLDAKPAKVRKDLDRRGVLQAVRSDIVRGKALQFLVDHAAVVDRDGNPLDLSLPAGNSAGESVQVGAEAADVTETTTEEPEA